MSAWLYDEQLEVRISSIIKNKADELLGKEQKVKFTSCPNDNLIWATIIPNVNSESSANKGVNVTKINSKNKSLYLAKRKFMNIIRNGCALCCCTILPSDTVYVQDVNKANEVLCEDCAKEHDDYDVKLEAFN